MFKKLHLVCLTHQCIKFDTKFMLGSGNLVVISLNHNPNFAEYSQHFRTHILTGINWQNRNIATLHARTMAKVSHLIFRIFDGSSFESSLNPVL